MKAPEVIEDEYLRGDCASEVLKNWQPGKNISHNLIRLQIQFLFIVLLKWQRVEVFVVKSISIFCSSHNQNSPVVQKNSQ